MAGLLENDPYALIRNLRFINNPMTVTGDPETGGYTQTLDNWQLGGDTGWDDLQAAGFQSKYSRIDPLGDGRFAVRMQQPGAHKYDTMEAIYQVNPETGQAELVGDPTATRETSSKDKWQDKIEKSGLLLGAVIGGGYGLQALTGAGAAGAGMGAAEGGAGLMADYGVGALGAGEVGSGAGWGLTQGAGAAGAGMGAGTMTAEQAAMLAANAPVGNAGGLSAWQAAQAAGGAAGAGGGIGTLGTLPAGSAPVASIPASGIGQVGAMTLPEIATVGGGAGGLLSAAAPYIRGGLALAGAIDGFNGNDAPTETTTTRLDPRIEERVYAPGGPMEGMDAWYRANPTGMNQTMIDANAMQRGLLTDPALKQSLEQMRTSGQGLMSAPVAANPWLNWKPRG